ncbi:membrane protein [Spirochaetia bacterium]|nr:membrane protein [Spirochaetia bacterium]
MNKVLREKIMEAFSSVLPITAIVLVVSVFLVPMPTGTILMFLVGAALLIIGMGFFTLGADMAMMPMGEGIGIQLTRSKSLFLILFISFVMGVIITIAEPDLQVLARQVPSVPPMALILTVAVGVGIFLLIAVLRTLLKIPLALLLIIFYIIVFGLVFFTPANFIPVAFDSGGVTTGPITVPFILAMGVGVASIRSDKNSQDDSFGLVALCSIGPILAVMLLGIFYHPAGASVASHVVPHVETSRDVVKSFAEELPVYAKEVLIALGAIVAFFVIFQLVSRRYKKHQLVRIGVGFVYTFIGLVVFLTGVNVGFIPVGQLVGSQLGAAPFRWILVPLGMLIGYFIVAAEPAVHVLNKQVEEISSGAISQKVMNRGLSIGMAIALGITMVRILTGIHLMWILIPGYAFALILTFFVPKIFTGIAFDSGGVCSGPMTSTFLLPLAMGTCEGVGRDLMLNAFGIVAMVAMTPLIIIQLLGLIYGRKVKPVALTPEEAVAEAISIAEAGAITEYDTEDDNEEEPSRE